MMDATNNNIPRTSAQYAVDADTLAFLGFTDPATYHPASIEIDAWRDGNWTPLYLLTHEQLEAAALFKLRQWRLPPNASAGDFELYAIVDESRVYEYPDAVASRELPPPDDAISALARERGINQKRIVVSTTVSMTPQKGDKTATPAEAASLVDLPEAQIVHACERGELYAERTPDGWRVRLNYLYEWQRRLLNDQVIGIAEAATYSGAPSEPTIRLHCGEGLIAGARKVGKSWTMPKRAFEQYLKRRNS